MEIAPGIFYEKNGGGTYLLKEGSRGTVIDPGWRAGRVEALMQEAGVEGLRLILVTHPDWDHSWAAHNLRERYGAPICAHSFNGTVDQPISPGETLPVRSGLQVIGTPGHTVADVSFYLEHEHVLFSGDALQNKGGWLVYAPFLFNVDHRNARKSYHALLKIPFGLLCPGHREPIWRQDARVRGEYAAMALPLFDPDSPAPKIEELISAGPRR
ncbi:MAG: MBL fold metallo-hydrolase [Nanoarchaeota archaeon]